MRLTVVFLTPEGRNLMQRERHSIDWPTKSVIQPRLKSKLGMKLVLSLMMLLLLLPFGNSQQSLPLTSLGVIPAFQPLTLSSLQAAGLFLDFQATADVTPPLPFTLTEKQIIHGQLRELRIVRIEVKQLQSIVDQERAQYEKDKAYWEAKIEEERKLAALKATHAEVIQKERDLALDKAQFYENAYNVCKANKKTSLWCKVKRFFTARIAKCK